MEIPLPSTISLGLRFMGFGACGSDGTEGTGRSLGDGTPPSSTAAKKETNRVALTSSLSLSLSASLHAYNLSMQISS